MSDLKFTFSDLTWGNEKRTTRINEALKTLDACYQGCRRSQKLRTGGYQAKIDGINYGCVFGAAKYADNNPMQGTEAAASIIDCRIEVHPESGGKVGLSGWMIAQNDHTNRDREDILKESRVVLERAYMQALDEEEA